MKKSNWKIKCRGYSLPANTLIENILKARGVEDSREFLNPGPDNILPFYHLANLDHAISLIVDSEHPLIYADTDTDGCTAAAILYRYLKMHYELTDLPFAHADPVLYINEGKDHGIQRYFECDDTIDTIIVVDSINDNRADYLEWINKGKKIVVLDHHKISEDIATLGCPEFALVSSAYHYPNQHLSGAGVVWKVCRYMDYVFHTNFSDELADLAACGIIADVCSVGPQSMDNRAICNLGFRNLQNPGLKALIGKNKFNSTAIGFNIAPLINAANRMNKNQYALKLFTTDNTYQIKEIIDELEGIKEMQKKRVDQLLPDAIYQAETQKDKKYTYYFLEDENDYNLTGLLATKICSTYHKPTFVLHKKNGLIQGSMRAEGIEDCSALTNKSGLAEALGHENSAGFCVKEENFADFFNYFEAELENYTFTQDYEIDAEIYPTQINTWLIIQLEHVNKITGADFKPIKFCVDNLTNYEVKDMSKGKHLCVETPGLKCIAWNFNDWDKIDKTKPFSAIGSLYENNFMGKSSNQLFIEDFNFADIEYKVDNTRRFADCRIQWF